MLKRLFTCAPAIPLATIMLSGMLSGALSGALSGCGDDGGSDNPDASGADAMQVLDGSVGIDAGADGGVPGDLTVESIAGGRFQPYGGYVNIFGAAHLVRMAEGLRAELHVEGLAASTEYIAHVHELPCGDNQAGSHYKHDPTIVEELEANEVWLRFTTDAGGTGVATTQLGQEKSARMDAQAIVIHDPNAGGAKMACADLFFDDPGGATIEYQGAFAPVAGAPAADQGIGGSVTATVSKVNIQTVITLDLEGIDPAATYVAHVHELPCEVNQAGGHYKRDTTIAAELESNEIWPSLATQDAQTFPHAARYDAQSVVLHRMEAGTPKVACANLDRVTVIPDYVTEGMGVKLPGVDNTYNRMSATARLTRKKDGTTAATLEVNELPDDVSGFGAHVHAGTCRVTPPGGAHYKLDTSITAEVESNEIWLSFDTNFNGAGTGSNVKDMHVARPDAISVVIHEPGTGTRLSCIDLN